MQESPSSRVLAAWVRLEQGLRNALPSCSVAPPTQPSELLAALRINHAIGPDEEARIRGLREARNRVAHHLREPAEAEADRFEAEVAALLTSVAGSQRGHGPGQS